MTAAGLLLVSCDKGPPTQPDPPPPTPPPFQRSTGPIAFVSDRDGTVAIYLANQDGSAVTRLTEGNSPAWSRDGRKIAFQRAFNIYVINVDGSGLQFVTQGIYPSWSPDGGLIALDDGGSIHTVNINGSNRQVVHSKVAATQPVWSPDGRLIAFSVTEYGYIYSLPGLGLVTADGSDPRYFGPYNAWAPAWSPDGSQIAFLTPSGIGVVGADGSGERQPVAGSVFDVDWTTDGRLVFSKPITPNFEGPWRTFISDGVERQLIADAPAPARQIYRDREVAWLR